jgi:hypothetical protein
MHYTLLDEWYALNPPLCIWTEDSVGGWKATCGETWYLETGTPAENHYRFCPGCGQAINVQQTNIPTPMESQTDLW